jgi:transposase
MLGPAQSRDLPAPIAVSLDRLVPRDPFHRHREAALDLGLVRDWVREAYSDRGRPSIDPIVFFTLSLVMFFEGIRSERQLWARAADRRSVRWHLGDGRDETLPDAAGVTRIRQRLGLAVFRRFVEHVITYAVTRDSSGGRRSWPTRLACLYGFSRAQTRRSRGRPRGRCLRQRPGQSTPRRCSAVGSSEGAPPGPRPSVLRPVLPHLRP